VVGAGSLGTKPSLGIELYSDLPPQDILPLCTAAIEFFEQYGDRENRRRARFRHVRERLGDRVFRATLNARFKRVKKRQSWPGIPPVCETGGKNIKLLWRLHLPNGNIEPSQAIELADTAEPQDAELRINLEHGLELYGRKTFKLPEELACLEVNPVIVSCPGRTSCPRALAETCATAESIRQTLAGVVSKPIRINISGCPNNCAHSAVGDIGLGGTTRKEGGKIQRCYRVFRGGGNGSNETLAKACGIVRSEDAPQAVRKLVEKQTS